MNCTYCTLGKVNVTAATSNALTFLKVISMYNFSSTLPFAVAEVHLRMQIYVSHFNNKSRYIKANKYTTKDNSA
jgi:hypothetical protein